MRVSLLWLFTIVSFACAAQKGMSGYVATSGKDFQYILELNKDSTFKYTHKGFEFTSQCEGRWYRLKEDSLLLKCGEVPIEQMLASGYMSEREKKVIILGANKLRIERVVLKKVRPPVDSKNRN